MMYPLQPKEIDFYKNQAHLDYDVFVHDGEHADTEWHALRRDFSEWYHDGGRLHSGVHYTTVVAAYHRLVVGVCSDMLRIAERAPGWQTFTEHQHRWMVWMGRELHTECNC